MWYDINLDDGKGGHGWLNARLVELRCKQFVDVYPVDENSVCLGCVPMHLVGELTIEEDTLRIRFLDASWVENRAKNAEMPVARTENALIHFAATAKLPEFLENYTDKPAAL